MTTKTIWRKAYELIESGWTTGTAELDGCYCAGGGIAAAITGDPASMYDDYKNDALWAALETFANHVGAPTEEQARADPDMWWDLNTPSERVFVWNDHRATQETVLKALAELDELERAK